MAKRDDPQADLPDLTALRGLLALWVFLYHINLHLQFAAPAGAIGSGYMGVDGFFILSGFVLARRHPSPTQTPAAYGRFWWRRFVRLYPTVLAVLLLLVLALLLARAGGVHPHQVLRASGREFWLQIFLLNGLGFSGGWTWNYPSWSISVEWVGYLLFPALAWGISGLGRRAVVCGLMAMVALLLTVAMLSPSGLNLSYQGALPRFLPEFLAGILLARLGRPHVSWAAIGFGAAVLLLLGLWVRRIDTSGDALIACALGLLLWALATGPQGLFTRLPGVLHLGALSYPFYMSYAPVELVFTRFWRATGSDPTQRPYLWFVLLFVSDIALAWIIARYVERPALRHLAGRRLDS